MRCRYCRKSCIKKGKRNGIQRYRCTHCNKMQQKDYTKKPISKRIYYQVKALNNEGSSMSSIGRLLKIAVSSVQRVIIRLVIRLPKPIFQENEQSYEIDELKTYCRNKENELWLIYAINRKTKQIIDFCVGRRTKENIRKVTGTLLLLNPKSVYSDKLNIYPTLLNCAIHRIYPKCTNHIG